MSTNSETPSDTDDAEPSSAGDLLANDRSLELADGSRGNRQLWLYLLSLPFWALVIFVPTVVVPNALSGAYGAWIPALLVEDQAAAAATAESPSTTVLGVAGAVGILGATAAILSPRRSSH